MSSSAQERHIPIGLHLTIVISIFTLAVVILKWVLLAKGLTHTLGIIGSSLVGLAGTVLAAYIAYNVANHRVGVQTQVARQEHREDSTFELHRDFSSDVLLRARSEADKLTLRNFAASYESLYERLPEQETRCLFLVTDFYERLWVRIGRNTVNKPVYILMTLSFS